MAADYCDCCSTNQRYMYSYPNDILAELDIAMMPIQLLYRNK